MTLELTNSMKRQIAYNAAGITHERLIELISEIEMYRLNGNTSKQTEKEADYHELLNRKLEIKQQYPIN